jgi:hypothetical protein
MNFSEPGTIQRLANALMNKNWTAEAADTLGAPADLTAGFLRKAGVLHPLQEPALGSQDLRRVFGVLPTKRSSE